MDRRRGRGDDAWDALSSLAGTRECGAAGQCGQQLGDTGLIASQSHTAPAVRPYLLQLEYYCLIGS